MAKSLSLLSYLILFLTLATYSLVEASDYSIGAPTAATRWVAGQQGLVIITSQLVKVNPAPTDNLLTITLERSKFLGSDTVATIKDGVQLLMGFNDTQPASLSIMDFVVPTTLPAGNNYFVKLKEGGFWFPRSESSSQFEIIAAPGGITTTGLPTMPSTLPPTTTTSMTPPTSTAAPTPTLPAGQTCNDIKEQCAAQRRTFVEATDKAPCSCGDALVVPTIIKNSAAPGSVKSTVKSTFQSTGGPTAALAVLLLVVMTLF
ncbi:hypothetical protein BGZ65_009742 [Modicella reniformis]|uniref:Uncharacterized protein n=1 Tax=Modicella reniformis TaxID=1440133 RepID=A0A9P6ME65_9FUNG|nr:hypothetical protein BGZ65_009742 [Modicella reniformis]